MKEKLIIRLMLLPCLVALVPLQFLIGLQSITRLGRAMEKTGRNLQEYGW